MTDTDADRDANDGRPPVIDRHEPPAEPKLTGPLGSIAGADRAGLGLDGGPDSAPSGAQVDPSEADVPGPEYGDFPATAEKPWGTTLATKSDDAGAGAGPDPEGEV